MEETGKDPYQHRTHDYDGRTGEDGHGNAGHERFVQRLALIGAAIAGYKPLQAVAHPHVQEAVEIQKIRGKDPESVVEVAQAVHQHADEEERNHSVDDQSGPS